MDTADPTADPNPDPAVDPLAGLELRWASTTADLRSFLGHLQVAFAEDIPDEDWRDLEGSVPPDRVLAVFDGDLAVGSAGDVPFQLTVPGGGRVAAAGVTLVGVLPTHRRRGILRWLMREQLERVHQRGDPVAVLWASESVIYGRFGYGLATFVSEFEIERGRTALARPVGSRGHVRLVDETEALVTFPSIYEPVAARTPGMLGRPEAWWRHGMLSDSPARWNEDGRKRLALLAVDGAPVAYAIYRVKSDWDARGPKGMLHALEVVGATASAETAMWQWLFGVDLVGRIKGVRGRLPHPLFLTLAEPRRLGLAVGDGLWLRLVDLPRALAARGYSTPGSVVLEVRDATCPWNAGRWRLTVDGRPGAAPGPARTGTVERTDDDADLVVDTADLAAAYLGGIRLLELAEVGRVDGSPTAVALASAMFTSDVAPWCSTPF